MDLRVYWTDTARSHLKNIFEFYKTKAGLEIAKKIIFGIINKSIILEINPFIGQKEENLHNRKNEYRYLVEGNYKIIYWKDNNYMKIAEVFDCRQNPDKIKTI